jgi:hypothetical protein
VQATHGWSAPQRLDVLIVAIVFLSSWAHGWYYILDPAESGALAFAAVVAAQAIAWIVAGYGAIPRWSDVERDTPAA